MKIGSIRWAVVPGQQGTIEQLPGASQHLMEKLPEEDEVIVHPLLVDPASREPIPLLVLEVLRNDGGSEERCNRGACSTGDSSSVRKTGWRSSERKASSRAMSIHRSFVEGLAIKYREHVRPQQAQIHKPGIWDTIRRFPLRNGAGCDLAQLSNPRSPTQRVDDFTRTHGANLR